MDTYFFTQEEFDEIKRLLEERFDVKKVQKQRIRRKIRKLGFRISDFHKGFDGTDLEKLLEDGHIIMKECIDNNLSVDHDESRDKNHKAKDRKYGLPPIIDDLTKVLILGTFPSESSLSAQKYYQGSKNQFWDVISFVSNEKEVSRTYKENLSVLRKSRIGLWDMINSCYRVGSSDAKIKYPELNDINSMLMAFPRVQTLVFNGKSSLRYFLSLSCLDRHVDFVQMNSTSQWNTHLTKAQKCIEWRTILKSYLYPSSSI